MAGKPDNLEPYGAVELSQLWGATASFPVGGGGVAHSMTFQSQIVPIEENFKKEASVS